MTDLTKITEHMEVVGADGAHVGTVDSVDGTRIKMTKADSGSHAGHHHYVSGGLVAAIEGNKVRLSANADVAVTLEEEKGGEGIADSPGLLTPRNIAIGAVAAVGIAAAGAAVISRRRAAGEADDTTDVETAGTGTTGIYTAGTHPTSTHTAGTHPTGTHTTGTQTTGAQTTGTHPTGAQTIGTPTGGTQANNAHKPVGTGGDKA